MQNKKLILEADQSYHQTTETERAQVADGCGLEGIVDHLVPDSLLGLSIYPACAVHDWDYVHGKTRADRKQADKNFLTNMDRLIDMDGGSTLIRLARKGLARIYNIGVRIFGGFVFENKESEFEKRRKNKLE